MEENPKENENQGGGENGKVQKTYAANLEKIAAILGDKKKLNPNKRIAGDMLGKITEELFKEDTEALEKEVKEGLRGLIKGKVAYDAWYAAEKKKLESAAEAKMKEFNTTSSALFNKIDGVDTILAGYKNALQAAGTAAAEEAQQQ